MSRLERLVNLTAALIDADRPLTREELRRRVGGYSEDADAFRRNFERDKDLLRQMGMPVTTEAVDPSRPDTTLGYRIRRADYELPDPGLDDAELAALRLATAAVQVDGADQASTTALRKLAGAPGRPTGGGGSGAGGAMPAGTATLPGGPGAAVVFGAVAARRRVRFAYRDQERLVDPWRLSYRNGQWYLSGWDHGRSAARLFRLDRIGGTVAADGEPGAFDRPAPGAIGPAPPWQIGDDEAVIVDLVVDAGQSQWARASLGEDAVVGAGPGGAVRFAVAVTNRPAFRSFVLGMLDHAEVVGPPEVRADLVGWLAGVAGEATGP